MASKRNNQVFEICQSLTDILSRYHRIKTTDIEAFAPVYYPIAIIEMDFDEQSFEDFDSIQLCVLKFIRAGITDSYIISNSMGINSQSYIDNVVQLLKNFGHISDNKITDLGMSSLKEEKKITLTRVKQLFQLDALNGNLLKIEENLISSSLFSSSETFSGIGHMDYLNGLPTDYVERQIRSVGFDHFKKYRSSILNTNVQTIHDITCKEVQYSKCYLMKLQSVSTPVVFAKRFNADGDSDGSRYFWSPLSVDKSAASRYFYGENLYYNSSDATGYINQLYAMLNDRFYSAFNNNHDKIRETLLKWNRWLHVPDKQIVIQTSGIKSGRCASVTLDNTNFTKFNAAIIYFLHSLSQSNELLLSCPQLYGKLISVITQDKYILATVSAYKYVSSVKQMDYQSIVKKVRTHIQDNQLENLQGEKLFFAIYEYLKTLASQN